VHIDEVLESFLPVHLDTECLPDFAADSISADECFTFDFAVICLDSDTSGCSRVAHTLDGMAFVLVVERNVLTSKSFQNLNQFIL